MGYAAQKAKTQSLPAPGEYATPGQAQKAMVIWHLLCKLPEESERIVFVTMRILAAELGIDRNTVMHTINALVRNGVIAVAHKGSRGTSNRYRIIIHTDR